MNRTRVLRTIVLPLVIALIATFALYKVLAGGSGGRGDVVETASVVVAARAIPAHTLITTEMVAVQEVPTTYAVPGAIRSADGCLGRVTLVPLAAGEVVLSSKITGAQPGSAGLSYIIPPGKRALTMQVNEIIGVAGFPQPGDRIDLLLNYLPPQSSERRTRMLLENIPILAVVQSAAASQDGAARPLNGYTSLTLEVTPEQAATVVMAESQGLLRVLLRPALDNETVGDFEIASTILAQPGTSLNPNIERRVGFEIRLLELDAAALTQLGYNLHGSSIVQISGIGIGAVNDIVNRGAGKVLDRATFTTPNRTAVTYGLTGEASTDAGAKAVPFGLTVSATPAYYGQGYVNVDTSVMWRIADVGGTMIPITTTMSAGAAGRCYPGDSLMAIGLVNADDLAAPSASVTRWALPSGFVSPEVLSGARVLVVVVTPSF
jgi:pilus assembly protein CpaB